ncbi:hypothetical protein BDZ91DRAFT_742642 [Kalaharituber pfeilii]|nr:hypothetical protein BDZ91DRAFT_742642 [Kalaharituber pfeilii]
MSDFNAYEAWMTECNVCAQEASHFCPRCEKVWYCSQECQRYDWQVHRHLCSSDSQLYPVKDPTKPSRRAIYFPEHGGRPTFVEVPFETWDEGYDISLHWERLGNEPIFRKEWIVQNIEVDKNPITGRDLGYQLLVGIKDDAMQDPKYKPNKCIKGLNFTSSHIPHSWPGPLRAVKVAPKSPMLDSHPRYLDIEIGDLRHLVDFFLVYGLSGAALEETVFQLRMGLPALPEELDEDLLGESWDSAPASPSSALHSPTPQLPTIWGITLYCKGDQAQLNVPPYDVKEITLQEAQVHNLQNWPVFDITQLIGLPIQYRRIPTSIRNLENPFWSPDNEAALLLQLDPKTGEVPERWKKDSGTWVIVRQDGRQLYPEHLEALVAFVKQHLVPLFEEWRGKDTNASVGTRKVDGEMTKERFLEWFEGYRREKLQRLKDEEGFISEKWISPFDVPT